jgi:hypothetical protein
MLFNMQDEFSIILLKVNNDKIVDCVVGMGVARGRGGCRQVI